MVEYINQNMKKILLTGLVLSAVTVFGMNKLWADSLTVGADVKPAESQQASVNQGQDYSYSPQAVVKKVVSSPSSASTPHKTVATKAKHYTAKSEPKVNDEEASLPVVGPDSERCPNRTGAGDADNPECWEEYKAICIDGTQEAPSYEWFTMWCATTNQPVELPGI
jgi:hypothetical protein